ncbi:PREDICTED: trypsin, alkaline C-like [Papilio polytes]|uniref:trypsin, alkaline C-like n=1 Tax=Papilio polytes TaxID=76194 RepID=UPI000675DD49|nr:PREDICTED: trypsin, alkaline C-like [Papilio polytes]
MASFKYFIFVLLLAGIAIETEGGRIVGGQPAPIEKYPSMVQVNALSILNTWVESCGANILTTRYILSAAHCFSGFLYAPSRRRIRAGTAVQHVGGVVVYIDREFVHPTWGRLGHDGDIAVVRLRGSLVYSPVIQQATIVSQGFKIPDNVAVVNAGWGAIRHYDVSSEILLDTTVYTVNNEECAEIYRNGPRPTQDIVTDNMICVNVPGGGNGTCQGDSGGPLYYGQIVVGIVSWAERCANETFPGVNTAVSSYTDWIVQTAV